MTWSEAHHRLDALADLGLIVSFCYGPSGGNARRCYSVDVLTSDGRSFPKPFGAETLEQAVWIAEGEGLKLLRVLK